MSGVEIAREGKQVSGLSCPEERGVLYGLLVESLVLDEAGEMGCCGMPGSPFWGNMNDVCGNFGHFFLSS